MPAEVGGLFTCGWSTGGGMRQNAAMHQKSREEEACELVNMDATLKKNVFANLNRRKNAVKMFVWPHVTHNVF